MWIQFWDIHSGGSTKEYPYEKIYIEADSEQEAKIIFYNRFGHNPERVSCTYCGEDYSIQIDETLGLSSAYHRGCKWNKKSNGYDENSGKKSIEEYCNQEDVLIITKKEIKDEERIGEVPTQGYVYWD